MDVESAPNPAKPRAPPERSHRCRNICISLVVIFVLIVVLIVILAFTVFKAKHPVTTVNSVKLKNLQASLGIAPIGLKLNVTLDVDLSVKNPNKAGFKYGNSTALLNYRGEQVGEVAIPAGKISADQTKQMNVTLTVLANRFLSNPQVITDYLSGVLPLSTYTKMSGKVTIMGLFKFRVVSTTTCDLSLFVSNRTVGNQQCKYKTKL
ncbi:LEA_2 domain-containing protein [Psidium guajava]|nr:LEA_2 domain-containing protein [Psidium guajava]